MSLVEPWKLERINDVKYEKCNSYQAHKDLILENFQLDM